jgi:hypothetical protein
MMLQIVFEPARMILNFPPNIRLFALRALKLKSLLVKIILFYGLLYIYVAYLKVIKSNIDINYNYKHNYEDYENNLCKPVNLSIADDLAKYYMSQSSYFEECDMLNGINLIELEDIFCNLNVKVCKNLAPNLDVVYRMTLNMKVLVKELRNLGITHESEIVCNLEKFVRVPNNTMEILTETTEIFNFTEKDNHILYLKSHGFYQVNVFLNKIDNKTKLYQDFYYIFPYDMSILLAESQHNLNQNNNFHQNLKANQKSNVFMIRLDSISYPQFKRQMPLTYDYLANKLENNIMYTMFNSVGENTHPNIIPLYSGIVVESIESLNISSESAILKTQNKGYFDKYPFIFYKYENQGYLTGFQVIKAKNRMKIH